MSNRPRVTIQVAHPMSERYLECCAGLKSGESSNSGCSTSDIGVLYKEKVQVKLSSNLVIAFSIYVLAEKAIVIPSLSHFLERWCLGSSFSASSVPGTSLMIWKFPPK